MILAWSHRGAAHRRLPIGALPPNIVIMNPAGKVSSVHRHAFALGVLILLAARAASAHHSTAEYDDEALVEATGTVVGVVWRNPHVRLTISTKDFDGETMLWELEGMGVMRLDRAGIPRDLVGVGTTVRFAGNPSRRRDRHMYVTNVLMPDGQEVLLRTTAQPRWSEEIVSIRRSSGITADAIAADHPTGIFRVWVPAGNQAPAWATNPPLTPAARAARVAYDPVTDDPLLRCTSPGMPRVISRSGGHPIQFIAQGNDIVLRNEYFALDRLIDMNPDADATEAAAAAPTPLGHSVGRWEDGALIVTTTGIDWPYFQLYGLEGVPQSPAMRIVERFTMSEDESELLYDIEATDPNVFTQTVVAEGYVTFRWQPGLGLLPYECILGPEPTSR
jgi:hypothetical protein